MRAAAYAPFCVADRYFYDVPEQIDDNNSRLAASHRSPPSGWVRSDQGLSVSVRPTQIVLPEQGWKIHVSARPEDVNRVIDVIWEYCTRRAVAFKFARSTTAAFIINSKYWERSAAGKLATLYPASEEQLASTLHDLTALLRGVRGPYILGDLRFGDGPLYLRYGAFLPMWCTGDEGLRLPAIRKPDGTLVQDRRGTVFTPPTFAPIPDILQASITNPPGRIEDFPYQIDHAMHFSNAGGVYVGRDPIGRKVVLREARPYAGLDGSGRDAVARLEHEHETLSCLQGLDCAPRLIEYRRGWEHHFLITEYVEGKTLLDEIIQRYPLVHPSPTRADLEDYVDWADLTYGRIDAALKSIRARGVHVGDLHPSNILVHAGGAVTIIDFECANFVGAPSSTGLGAPGFVVPDGLSLEEEDSYVLACVRLMILLPLVPLISIDRAKTATLVDVASDILPVDPRVGKGLKESLGVTNCRHDQTSERDRAAELFTGDQLDWQRIRTALVRGIVSTGSPERSDRLFPGDPLQFSCGGATLGYGAAGVILALSNTPEGVPREFVDWLLTAGIEGRACHGTGFYDGLHGVAYVLNLVGERDAALSVLKSAVQGSLPSSVGLFGGRSGVALNLLHFARLTDNGMMYEDACRLAKDLIALMRRDPGRIGGGPGLFHGLTGVALLCLDLYKRTTDEHYLDAVEQALTEDLSLGVFLRDGTFQIQNGSRRLLYLDGGSVGIGLVLAQFLKHRPIDRLQNTLAAILRGCRATFVLQPGLFQGRAGLIAGLAMADLQASVTNELRRLGWHAVWHEGGISFPGSGLTRLSTDLATGSAGILLAMRAVLERGPLGLPFLDFNTCERG